MLSSCQQKPEEPQKLYEKYRNSVVLIKNKYYYSLTFENGKQLFFTPNEKGSTPQIHANEYEAAEKACFAFGTGFFIGREGQIATNRHVVNPLEQGKETPKPAAAPSSKQSKLTGKEKRELEQIGRRRVGKECLRLCRSRWSPYH